MSEPIIAEQSTEKAPGENVVTPRKDDSERDFEAELAEKDAAIAKIAIEKENYRLGMLKAKKKLPVEDENYGEADDKPDIEAMVAHQVQIQLANSTEARLLAEKDAITRNLAQQNRELRTALKNKDQTISSGQGSSTEGKEVGDNYFSAEQLTGLKAKGWDDKKIQALKENMQKGGMMPPPASPLKP